MGFSSSSWLLHLWAGENPLVFHKIISFSAKGSPGRFFRDRTKRMPEGKNFFDKNHLLKINRIAPKQGEFIVIIYKGKAL
jgi:hypothetical protein